MDQQGKTPGDYPRRVHEGMRRLVQDLRAEAEKSRALVAALRSEKQLLEGQMVALRDEVDRVSPERQHLEAELAEIEARNPRHADEFAVIEAQHSNLASLYVASYRLHETLNRQALFDIVQEVIANLVGSEELAILELDGSGAELGLSRAYGIEPSAYERRRGCGLRRRS